MELEVGKKYDLLALQARALRALESGAEKAKGDVLIPEKKESDAA